MTVMSKNVFSESISVSLIMLEELVYSDCRARTFNIFLLHLCSDGR